MRRAHVDHGPLGLAIVFLLLFNGALTRHASHLLEVPDFIIATGW